MRIIWSSRAETDLYNAISYIAEQSPQNAKQVSGRIKKLVKGLTNQPYKFQKDELYNNENVRRAVIYSYKIVYKIYNDKIVILRVFSTHQHPDKIL